MNGAQNVAHPAGGFIPPTTQTRTYCQPEQKVYSRLIGGMGPATGAGPLAESGMKGASNVSGGVAARG